MINVSGVVDIIFEKIENIINMSDIYGRLNNNVKYS